MTVRVKQWWLQKISWPCRRLLGRGLCAFNKHDWSLDAPQLDKHGEFDWSRPGRFQRCARPDCRLIREIPRMQEFGQWVETDDFMVIAKKSCVNCHGRGYRGKMILDKKAGILAKVPCGCLRVQPSYLERRVMKDEPECQKSASGSAQGARAS